MNIKKIKLVNFRNYKNETVLLDGGLNVLLGENAQGKTNLIEAIYFSCISKSPRTKRENELILWNENSAKIELEVKKREGTKKIEITLHQKGKKNIKINGVNIIKVGELIGTLSCVFFSPDELKLVKESPQDRRRFMDIDLSQLSKNYFYLLNTYNKILAQRNKLLKDTKSIEVLKQTISIWDTQLAKIGGKIIIRRIRFLNALKVYAKAVHLELTSNKEVLELAYEGLTGKNEQELEEMLLKEYEKTLDKDFKLGFTSVGPHRDDIKILTNNIDAKSFASQGQQRTIALSLKLAELEIFKSECGEYPVLLLDDVLSELDDTRKQKLLQKTKEVQTIITTTSYASSQKAKVLKIKNGTVKV